LTSSGGDTNAAVPGGRGQSSREVATRLKPFDETPEELEVHSAHKVALLFCEAMERAVPEGDLGPTRPLRFVALPGEYSHHRVTPLALPARAVDRFACLLADAATGCLGRVAKAVADRSSRRH
jgi:hypothetical protein